MLLDAKAILAAVSVKLVTRLEDDEELTNLLRNKVVDSFDAEEFQKHPEIQAALAKLVISVIEGFDPDNDDGLFSSVKESLEIPKALEFLVEHDEGVKTALKSKLQEELKDYIENIDSDSTLGPNDETLDDIIGQNIVVDGDLVTELISGSDALKQNLKDKVAEFVETEIENLETDDDISTTIKEHLPIGDAAKEVLESDPEIRAKLNQTLQTILGEFLDNNLTEKETERITNTLLDSPVLIDFIDAAATKLMQKPEYQSSISRLVEQVMGNPTQMLRMVQERLAETIAADLAKRIAEHPDGASIDLKLT